jgi:phage tail sheath protein FI
MANYVSPGVYVVEKDVSDYVPSLDSSIVGVVGFASKGPVNTATLVTSPQSLINTFGTPGNGLPGQGLEGAVTILEATNSLYFVRGVHSSALEASTVVTLGACPAVTLSGNSFGVTQNIYLDVQVYDKNGTAKFPVTKQFNIPSGTVSSTASQSQALIQVIGGGVDQSHVGATYLSTNSASGYIFGSYAGSAAKIVVTAYSNSTRTTGLSALFALDGNGSPTGFVASSVTASGVTINNSNSSGVSYFVKTLYPGAGYNTGTQSDGTASGNSVEITTLGNANTILEVNDAGTSIEQFKNNLQDTNSWIETVINTGITNTKSNVIRGYLVSCLSDFTPTKLTSFADTLSTLGVASIQGKHGSTALGTVNPRFVKFVEGTYNLAGGTNGTSSDNDTNALALIGDPTLNPKTGIYALDDDTLNVSIACAPGFHNQYLDNAGVTLAETSQNFIWLVAPPYGTIDTAQEAIDWHNGLSETRSASINSSWAAIYFPWLQEYSVFEGIDKWMDPVIYAARQMCYTDSVSEPWFAPAGYSRGRLTKPVAVEVKLNQGDRDALYSGGNVINPIVNFAQDGIMIFGQRTAQRTPTALDRINVRRLMIMLRKLLLASNRRYTFEPNDVITWERIKVGAEGLLDDIRRRRGLTDFKVVCDETTNTPARIDRNELWCKIILIPTKAAEAIVFELNITSNSAKLGS